MRSTKIVATIGPASEDVDVLTAMIVAGMDVARLNFAHGTREQHAELASRIREAAGRAGREVAILGDLPGYGTADVSAGMKKDKWSFDVYMKNVFDNRGEIANYAECQATVCGGTTYIIPTAPRTIGVRVTRDFD